MILLCRNILHISSVCTGQAFVAQGYKWYLLGLRHINLGLGRDLTHRNAQNVLPDIGLKERQIYHQ